MRERQGQEEGLTERSTVGLWEVEAGPGQAALLQSPGAQAGDPSHMLGPSCAWLSSHGAQACAQ